MAGIITGSVQNYDEIKTTGASVVHELQLEHNNIKIGNTTPIRVLQFKVALTALLNV